MLVFDTSCYVNGQRDHFKMEVTPTIWAQVGEAIETGKVLIPREVYRELDRTADEVFAWIETFKEFVMEPGEMVQRLAGTYAGEFRGLSTRNAADPFVLAEAQTRGFTVSTYEGRTFRGVPTSPERWHRSMPGVCKRFKIPCCTLPEALQALRISV